jgi:glycosidase
VLSNHDRPRSTTRLYNDVQKAMLLALLQLTVRGIPFVCQGEEIGMRTVTISAEDALDPLARDYSPLPALLGKILSLEFNRDNERTPMHWDGSPNAGFTEAGVVPWLPSQSNYVDINVERRMSDTTSLWNTYRALPALCRAEKALRLGSLPLVDSGDLPEGVLAYERSYGSRRISVYLNLSDRQGRMDAEGRILYVVGSVEGSGKSLEPDSYSGALVAED